MNDPDQRPTGAQSLIRTLLGAGVDICFTNPGTSEMHFVAGLDSVPEMRSVLALFEGVATGAADGYARMADKPASTLLHLGPGLGNGLANLHNARKAHTPLVNIVGDHATYFTKFDAPLQSDIEAIARGVSSWIRTSRSPDDVARDAAEAVAASLSPPGQVATLILPADVSWSPSSGPVDPTKPAPRAPASDDAIAKAVELLRGSEPCALLLGGMGLREPGLRAASRVASATGARMLSNTFPARLERGAGRPAVERLPYLPEMVTGALGSIRRLILVGAKKPVGFFAYPSLPNDVVPESCEVYELAGIDADVVTTLEHLANAVGAKADQISIQDRVELSPPSGGSPDPNTIAQTIGALLPENAIVSDEGNTAGVFTPFTTVGSPAHDWLCLTGGSIGQGMPLATGAACACPDRKVVSLEADGSAMYTLQALWTQAREGLDVTTVIFANRSYAVLNLEMARLGLGSAGEIAKRMLDLKDPVLDFVELAKGMGVPAVRVDTVDAFVEHFGKAMQEKGPRLIEVVVAM